MGPLVPDIIGNELNFVVAILIGIAFGFILEQAGFSTSKKLVGLFYGYDFTVLRVFFTAGLTAMFGVIAFNHFGLLDVSLIYINPTFLWSALVGGAVMGLGFVIGGFCPGTSVCAAAIGKIDAMIFIAGSALGVLIFTEGYPLFESLFKAEAWGNVQIFDTLGMSQSLFAFLLIVVALAAFWAVSFIEKKVNKINTRSFINQKYYLGLTGTALVLGLLTFLMPDRRENLISKSGDEEILKASSFSFISPDELTFRLLDNDNKIQIFDFREKTKYDSINLPGSANFTLENLFEQDANKRLSIRERESIFVADNEDKAKQAAYLADKMGYKRIRILQGGFNTLTEEILNFNPNSYDAEKITKDTFRFREKAGMELANLIKEHKDKSKAKPEKKAKRVLGGC